MRALHRRMGLAGLALAGALALAPAAMAQSDATWQSIKGDVFGEKPIAESSPLVSLTAPTRAEDAALVPVDVRVALPEGDSRRISAVTLIVDENPAPVAATFRFGADQRDVTLSTRLRVNSYSYVRAVAETDDGRLHMTTRFVKASGGCSAPALKDAQESLARLGEMRFRIFKPEAAGPATPLPQAQLMIRHPNYSGLQMDQITRLYIPAKFVRHIVVRQGDELVFEMEGGISLSEDPTIRFSYVPKGPKFEVLAEDTDGKTFSRAFEAKEGLSGS
jgi:sulfur-oxidizing protein SoxY